MNRPLAVAAALLLSLPAAAESAASAFTADDAKALTEEAVSLIEKETGAKLDPRPVSKIATAAEVAEVLAGELLPQMPILQPGLDEDGRRQSADATASLLSTALFGKYAPATNTIYFVTENYDSLAKLYGNPALAERDSLRTVAIHELAHAADHAKYRVFDRIAGVKSADELNALNAVIEGHAQFVTWRILKAEKDGEARFAAFEKIVGAVPPGRTDGERIVLEMLNSLSRFAYHDGFEFFRALEKSGPADFVDAVFKAPPTRKDVILHPERFGKDDAGPGLKDLSALWDAIREDHSEGWRSQVVPVGEVEIRSSFSDLVPKEKLDTAVKSLEAGQLLALVAEDGTPGKMIAVGVMQFTDEAAAKRMLALNEELLKAKDEKMKEGPVRITEAKYEELEIEGVGTATDARKTISVSGQELKVRDTSCVIGRYVVEIVHSRTTVKKEALRELIRKVAEALKEEEK